MRVDFLAEALDELHSAAEWLDAEGGGLGDAFLAAVEAQLARLQQFPYLARQAAPGDLPEDVRQRVVRRYRYLLIYRVQGDVLQVVAVSHMRRRPGYWRSRLG